MKKFKIKKIKRSSDITTTDRRLTFAKNMMELRLQREGESSFLYLRNVGALVLMPEKYMSKSTKKSQDEK